MHLYQSSTLLDFSSQHTETDNFCLLLLSGPYSQGGRAGPRNLELLVNSSSGLRRSRRQLIGGR